MGAFTPFIPMIAQGANESATAFQRVGATGETIGQLKAAERQERLRSQQEANAIRAQSRATIASQRALLAAQGIDPEGQGTPTQLREVARRSGQDDLVFASLNSRNRLDVLGRQKDQARAQRVDALFGSTIGIGSSAATRGIMGQARGLLT